MSRYPHKARAIFLTLNPAINVPSIIFGLISACIAILFSSIHLIDQFDVQLPINLLLSDFDQLPTPLATFLYIFIYFLIAVGMGAFLPIVLLGNAIPIEILGPQPLPAAILALVLIFVWWFIIGFIIARIAKRWWKVIALWITTLLISVMIVLAFL